MGNFLSSIHTKEGFESLPRLRWEILSVSDAKAALEDAEARDEYYEMVSESPNNYTARGHTVWSPVAAPREWEDLMAELEFPVWTNGLDIKIIAAPSNVEGGMPHTRPTNIVCIPIDYTQQKVVFEKMMIHEIVHILQRMYYDGFMRFIKADWHYRPLSRREMEKLPYKLLKRRRINPDTLACPLLIWNNNWVPIIVFNDHIDGPRLKSARIIWWDLVMDRGAVDPPEEWLEFFGTAVTQNEHPFEIAAWYLSDTMNAPGATLIRSAIRTILSKK